LTVPQRRAVSIETGSQNIPLALGIILISFPSEIRSDILIVPLLYGMIIVPLAALTAWLFRRSGPPNKFGLTGQNPPTHT
jgi:BASS family bile acid:Na+ symporter